MAQSDPAQAIGDQLIQSVSRLSSASRSGLHRNMKAEDAFKFFISKVVPEAKQVMSSLIKYGPELDGSAIIAALDDFKNKDGLRTDPNDASVRDLLSTMAGTTHDITDLSDRNAVAFIESVTKEAKVAMSVLAPGSKAVGKPDLNMDDPTRLLYHDAYNQVATVSPTIGVSLGHVSIHDPTPTFDAYSVIDSSTSVVYSFIRAGAASINLCEIPAGTYEVELNLSNGLVYDYVNSTSTSIDGHFTNGCGLLLDGAVLSGFFKQNGASGFGVTRYAFTVTKPSVLAAFNGAGVISSGRFSIVKFANATSEVPTGVTAGSTVSDIVGTINFTAYSEYIITVQSAFGSCLFDATCMYAPFNAFYQQRFATEIANPPNLPSSVDKSYLFMTTYASGVNPILGGSHIYTQEQLAIMYDYLYNLYAIELCTLPVNISNIRKVVAVQDEDLQNMNTSSMIQL
jgi:hypothetical protein